VRSGAATERPPPSAVKTTALTQTAFFVTSHKKNPRDDVAGIHTLQFGYESQPPTSPLMTGPNSVQVSPLNFISCSCSIG
jgi:hypothetical protein